MIRSPPPKKASLHIAECTSSHTFTSPSLQNLDTVNQDIFRPTRTECRHIPNSSLVCGQHLKHSKQLHARCDRDNLSTNGVFITLAYSLTTSDSCAVVNKIDPSLQCNPSLPAQLLHRNLKCLSRSFVIWHTILVNFVREHSLVEVLR